MTNTWFNADKEGLRKLIDHLPKEMVLYELVQNVWDENASYCKLTIERMAGSPFVLLTCEDDVPEGFSNLAHAYTIWAESEKKADPTKAGRFNEGEKKVLALCRCAMIRTTTGTVLFNEDGSRTTSPNKTEKGSVFKGEIRLTQEQVKQVEQAFQMLIPTGKCKTSLNEEQLVMRDPVCEFEITLPTFKADDEGQLRPTARKTKVSVYEPASSETPTLYECGIPVVGTGDKWHVVVHQKVPLNRDRDNVTPAYLRKIRAAVLNHTSSMLSEEESAEQWVSNALEDESIEDEAIEDTLDRRFGKKRFVRDPNDPESAMTLQARGYVAVEGGSLSKRAWQNIRRAGAVSQSSALAPTPKPYSNDPNAPVRKEVKNLSEGMQEVADICRWFASKLGVEDDLQVLFVVPAQRHWAATWTDAKRNFMARSVLEWNVSRLGRRFFDEWVINVERILNTLLHEFAHERASNHLDERFHRACTHFGGSLGLVMFLYGDEIPHFAKVREHYRRRAA